MSDCAPWRELLAVALDDGVPDGRAEGLRHHLEGCAECRAFSEAFALVGQAGAAAAELAPPPTLVHTIAGSPCRPWHALLFAALDDLVAAAALARLLDHLEACPTCASLWSDLTLVHQASASLVPPAHLLHRCVWGVKRRQPLPVLGRRAAVAVAYALTVVATLVIGNPVTLARNPATEALRSVTGTVSAGLDAVSADGRGEAKVLLWRVWSWTSTTADAARQLLAAVASNRPGELATRSSEQGDTT